MTSTQAEIILPGGATGEGVLESFFNESVGLQPRKLRKTDSTTEDDEIDSVGNADGRATGRRKRSLRKKTTPSTNKSIPKTKRFVPETDSSQEEDAFVSK